MNKRCFQLAAALLAGLSLFANPVLADSQTKQTQTASQQTTQVTQPSQAEQTAQPNQTDQAAKTSSQIKKATRKKKVVKVNLKDYLTKKPVVIRTKKAVTLYKNSSLSKKFQNVGKGAHYLVSSLSKNKNGVPVLRLSNGKYVAAKKSWLAAVKPYQNPKKYHQVHYTRIKPYGQVGYTVKRGYEGIKTYLIMKPSWHL